MRAALRSRELLESEPTEGLQTPLVPLPMKHPVSLQGPQLGTWSFPVLSTHVPLGGCTTGGNVNSAGSPHCHS